jgi:hypothetical protein
MIGIDAWPLCLHVVGKTAMTLEGVPEHGSDRSGESHCNGDFTVLGILLYHSPSHLQLFLLLYCKV